jgi:hypothetical protein
MADKQLTLSDDMEDACRKCEKQDENEPVPKGCPLIEMALETRSIDPDVVVCL